MRMLQHLPPTLHMVLGQLVLSSIEPPAPAAAPPRPIIRDGSKAVAAKPLQGRQRLRVHAVSVSTTCHCGRRHSRPYDVVGVHTSTVVRARREQILNEMSRGLVSLPLHSIPASQYIETHS